MPVDGCEAITRHVRARADHVSARPASLAARGAEGIADERPARHERERPPLAGDHWAGELRARSGPLRSHSGSGRGTRSRQAVRTASSREEVVTPESARANGSNTSR